MRFSEDDKWYISDAANTALPALINSLKPADASDSELRKYAYQVGQLAYLIGLEMLFSREATFAAIEQPNEKDENVEA